MSGRLRITTPLPLVAGVALVVGFALLVAVAVVVGVGGGTTTGGGTTGGGVAVAFAAAAAAACAALIRAARTAAGVLGVPGGVAWASARLLNTSRLSNATAARGEVLVMGNQLRSEMKSRTW